MLNELLIGLKYVGVAVGQVKIYPIESKNSWLYWPINKTWMKTEWMRKYIDLQEKLVKVIKENKTNFWIRHFQRRLISIFWSSFLKVVVVVEAIVARSVEKALRQVSLQLPSSWNLKYLTMKHPEKLSWVHQDYFREILQEEQMASQVRVQSAWSENRRELCEKYLDVIIKKLRKRVGKGDWNLQVAYI